MKGWVELHWNFIGREGKNQHTNTQKPIGLGFWPGLTLEKCLNRI